MAQLSEKIPIRIVIRERCVNIKFNLHFVLQIFFRTEATTTAPIGNKNKCTLYCSRPDKYMRDKYYSFLARTFNFVLKDRGINFNRGIRRIPNV